MLQRLALVLCLISGARLSAEVALLVGEPFGKFGFFNPTGHAAVYLARVCADTPVKLRMCREGETGVVISRYNRIAGYDWIAIPLLPYLYAVERGADVPESAAPPEAAAFRDAYRKLRLRTMIPDGPDGSAPKGDWIQLVGATFDRQIHGFVFDTSEADDERLVRILNAQHNRRRFNLFFQNCADFASSIVNFYRPRTVRRSILADAGIMTPKHMAKSLLRSSRKHPDMPVSYFVIPQVSGSPRSTKLRGVNESLVRSWKYAVPLVVMQPWVAATAAAGYFVSGRFNPPRSENAVCSPLQLQPCMAGARRRATKPESVVGGG